VLGLGELNEPEASRKKSFDAVCVSDSGFFWMARSVLTLEPLPQSMSLDLVKIGVSWAVKVLVAQFEGQAPRRAVCAA
jgi:hypothetical protein